MAWCRTGSYPWNEEELRHWCVILGVSAKRQQRDQPQKAPIPCHKAAFMSTVNDEDFYDSTVEVTVSRDMTGFMRVAEQQQAMLLVLSGARIGHRILLGESELSIGRGSACGLILDADSVSRQDRKSTRLNSSHVKIS